MQIKHQLKLFLVLLLAFTLLVGCSTNKSATKEQVIKLGVNGSNLELWKYIQGELAKENIKLEIISFADYVRPNLALAEGELDANAFQHIAYLNKFKADHNLDIVPIGNTILAPMAIYSKYLQSVKDVPEGGKIALPNDATNGGRALILLQDAGLIKLRDDIDLLPTVKDIVSNPKNLELIELIANQIPRSLEDVSIAVINNGIAVDAGFSPVNDSIFIENVKNKNIASYINVIAVRTQDKDKPLLKRLVEVYHTEETKKVIADVYKGAMIPAF